MKPDPRCFAPRFSLPALLASASALSSFALPSAAPAQDVGSLLQQALEGASGSGEGPQIGAVDLLVRADILDALRLDNGQRDKIKTLVDDFRRQEDEIRKAADERVKGATSIGERLRLRTEARAEVREKTTPLRVQTEKSLFEVLQPQQQEELRAKLKSPPAASPSSSPAPSATTASPGGTTTPASTVTTGPSAPSRPTVSPAVRTADTVASFQALPDEAAASGTDPTVAPKGPADGGAPPADSPAPRPATSSKTPAQLSFNFHAAPWTDVLKLFAEAAGLTLNLRDVPPGTFTYYDRRSYAPAEALDVMNRFLLQDGFLLLRHDRFLTVLSTKNPVPPNLVETVEPDQLAERGATEYLRVVMPLGDRDAAKAADEVRALLGPQGKVAPLESAGSLVVTDIADNLRRALKLIQPPPKVGAAETTFRAFPLKNIRAEDAADTVRNLFGISTGVANVAAGQSGSSSSSSRSSGFDPRSFFSSRFGGGSPFGGGPFGGGDSDEGRSRDSGRGSSSGGGGSGSSGARNASTTQAKVAVDPRTNSVLVAATPAEMRIVEEIVKAIDVPNGAAEGTPARRAQDEPYLEVYTVGTADPQEVAKTLGVLHPGTVVNEDGRAKRLHVWASPAKHREIESHIRQLDGTPAGESIAIVPLGGLNPYDAVASLGALYASDGAGAPKLQADPSGGSLIVKGSVSQIAQIRSLVERLESQGAVASQRAVRVVPVGNGNSEFVSQTLGALYPQVTISSPPPTVTSSSTSRSGSGSGSSSRSGSPSGGSSEEDAERAERMRRFMEFRDRFFGGSGGSSPFGRSGGDSRSDGDGGRRSN